MKKSTACFSGHRVIPVDEYETVTQRLREAITALIGKGYQFFGAGGALGFDTLAALTILALKQQYPHIRLILVLPCCTQAAYWLPGDQAVYNHTVAHADKVVYISRHYTADCMHRRNRHLVENSSACICYMTKSTGGTAYTVRYARSRGLKIINIASTLR